ncbi:putative lipoprotein LpqT [Mycobacterium sp. MFM001]|uniref:LpqN/LpqT family lipoprotein n=1 Tax=Mycobacterium sp. MFM001 TaxID=2049453 RepID=UPI000DA4C5AA|nr:LpqN/LpqT family lipoprotein [Mycobacterium sp. MFM001]GBE64627.1 putative lipoprotein LpqT [Mycobacterium sp. MFM001]
MKRLLVAAALVLLTAGCGPKTPDYQSIWTTSATSTTPTSAVAPIPFPKYLEQLGVGEQPVAPDTLTDLTVSIPTPPGWSKHTSPAIPPSTEVITKDGPYPNAMLIVVRLFGEFDPRDAIKHGNADAARAENYRQLDASDADFHGFPSSMIQGSYDLDGKRLHTYNRVVIATGSPPDSQRYLVQLAITSLAEQAVTEAGDIEKIINGFTVAAK